MIGRTNAVIGKSGSRWPSADEVQVTYTGTMKDPREITDAAGNKYVLYELTSSGKLTVDKTVPVDICFVAGGSGGCGTNSYNGQIAGVGGKGGQLKNTSICLQSTETYEITVGAGGEANGWTNGNGGDTKISVKSGDAEMYSLLAECDGTCGGWSYDGRIDVGFTDVDGLPKYVFGDSSVYSYPICAGGGGAAYAYKQYNADETSDPWYLCQGTDGGSNGSGYVPVGESVEVGSGNSYTGDYPVSNGGNYGGGKSSGRIGGTVINAEDGYAYGCGGGGQARYRTRYDDAPVGLAGAGFQGVVFIRILK